MGIALYPLHADDAGNPHEARRHRHVPGEAEPQQPTRSTNRAATSIRCAVSPSSRSSARPSPSDALELHFQPKIDLATERAIHAEALVRWRHPVYGLMLPDEFIPLAEQSGNIGIITKWVLKRAIEDCAGWNRAGFDLGVAVNLSALDLYDAELPTLISGLLHDQGLDPSKLVLEITESAVMKDAAYALKTLRDVKARGITLAIDDFGTGYSSLAHLKRLPLDELKIDKSFVVNLSEEATDDGVIVRSTIDLGHNMGLKVVAEGVESSEGLRDPQALRLRHGPGVLHQPPAAFAAAPRLDEGVAVGPSPCSLILTAALRVVVSRYFCFRAISWTPAINRSTSSAVV